MRGVKNEEVLNAAAKLGMSPSAFKRRLKTMSFEEAAAMPKMTVQQAARRGKSRSPWRYQKVSKNSLDIREVQY